MLRRFFCWLMLALLASGIAHAADPDADKAELKKLEHDFAGFVLKNDFVSIGEKLAPEWKLVLGDGSIMTRQELLDAMKSRKLTFSAYSVDDLDIRLYGDAAVVIGVDISKGSWEGTEFKGRDRFTDVFVRQNGKWLCVSSHSTDLPDEK